MFRKQKSLYTPTFLIYSNCKIKISVFNTNYINCISVTEPVPLVMLVDDYKKILLASHNNKYVKYLDNVNAEKHNEMINNALIYIEKKMENIDVNIIKKEILSLTHYDESLENWNITNLARKYMLNGFDIFSVMATGINEQNTDERKLMLKNDFEKKLKSNSYAYFDYYDGSRFRMKNAFPKDIDDDKNPLVLNMRRYDEYENSCGYIKIFKSIAESINKNKINNNFISWKEIKQTHEIKNIDILNKVITHNKLVMNSLTPEEKIFIEKKQQYCFNHRHEIYGNDEMWEYQTSQFYNSYIKQHIIDKNDSHKLELFYAFNCDFQAIHFNNSAAIEDVSVINMLMYGKTMVKSLEDIERLLSYVRFKEIVDVNSCKTIYQLDNYVIDYKSIYSNDSKRYIIKWNHENVDELTFVQKDIDKLYAAKYLIQLMNEVDPNLLNFHNYNLVSKWYVQNDLAIQTAHIATTNYYKK